MSGDTVWTGSNESNALLWPTVWYVHSVAKPVRSVAETACPLLTAQTVKFFADGVVENGTDGR